MSAGAFHFRLEGVRALRERAEDAAKQELASSLQDRARHAGVLAAAGDGLARARAAHRDAASAGTSAAELLAHQAYLERTERTEQAAVLALSRQEAEVDARLDALRRAAQERQVLEKLKERRLGDHRREAERREGAELDELALRVHRRARAGA